MGCLRKLARFEAGTSQWVSWQAAFLRVFLLQILGWVLKHNVLQWWTGTWNPGKPFPPLSCFPSECPTLQLLEWRCVPCAVHTGSVWFALSLRSDFWKASELKTTAFALLSFSQLPFFILLPEMFRNLCSQLSEASLATATNPFTFFPQTGYESLHTAWPNLLVQPSHFWN